MSAALALLSVDEAGTQVLAAGPSLSLGHAHGGQADLGFLADLAPRVASFELGSSFAHGPSWSILPQAGERVRVDARPAVPSGQLLRHGQCIELGANLALRVLARDPASASLELAIGAGFDCAGATRIFLLAPGPAGVLRIGASARAAVRVGAVPSPIELELCDAQLVVRCAEGLARAGAEAGAQHAIGFPPARRETFSLPRRAAREAPLCLWLEPLPPASRPARVR